MDTKNRFIFVVCGADEHIETLNLALLYLKKFSQNEIWVLTDTTRNTLAINHPKEFVIDEETPKHFDHHQASIYLKTGIHKFVDLQHNYCYLDTDVLAVNLQVDTIFEHYKAPITFTSDHCKMPAFSPYALNCGCKANNDKACAELKQLINRYEQFNNTPALKSKLARLLSAINDYKNLNENDTPTIVEKRKHLFELFKQARNPIWKFSFVFLFKILPKYKRALTQSVWYDWDGNVIAIGFKKYMNDKGFYYKKSNSSWYDKTGNLIYVEVAKKVAENSHFIWDKKNQTWLNGKGEKVFELTCNHLPEKIKSKFNIEVKDANFQHWNGGVFMFNKESVNFLDSWHNMTMEIFKDPEWKTRDQGTLIASVWKHGLQNHYRFPITYDFIADYYKANISFKPEKGFSLDSGHTYLQPHFVHIYHHWADKTWDVWQWVEEVLEGA